MMILEFFKFNIDLNIFLAEDWGVISKEAKNLILKMLEIDPN